MKNKLMFIGLMLLVIMGTYLITKINLEARYKAYGNNLVHTDTIFVDKIYKPSKPLPLIKYPEMVMIYKFHEIKVDSVIYRDKILEVNTPDDRYEFDIQYLVQFPLSKKLINLDLRKSKLDVTLLNLDGQITTESFNVNLDDYEYRFINNQMTSKMIRNKVKFGMNVEYTIRPLMNLHDLDFNLSLKTKKFIYTGGLNTHYYPWYKNSVGVTPKLSIKYNF